MSTTKGSAVDSRGGDLRDTSEERGDLLIEIQVRERRQGRAPRQTTKASPYCPQLKQEKAGDD